MTTLSDDQLASFHERGFVKLEGAFAPEHAACQRAMIWSELAQRDGVLEDDRTTWRQPRRQLRQSRDHGLQKDMATPRLLGALDDVLGTDAWMKQGHHWGSILFTFPNAHVWDVPKKTWHWDTPIAPHRRGAAGVQMFSLLAPLSHAGGGTVFIAGMHEVLLRYYDALEDDERTAKHATHRKRVMKSHPWLRELAGHNREIDDRESYFMTEGGDVDGLPVCVQEMTGEPGDVYLLHPLSAHTWAPNAGDTPRIMRSKMIVHRDFDWRER